MKIIIALLLIATTLATAAGFFPVFIWYGDLFNNLRPYIAILSFFLFFGCIRWLEKYSVATALALLALNIFMSFNMMNNIQPAIETVPPPVERVRVLSADLGLSNVNYADVVQMVFTRQPDIFLAIETNTPWLEGLKPIEKFYPYTVKYAQNNQSGMTIYSKKPFKATVNYIGNMRMPIMMLEYSGYVFIGAHAPFPDKINAMGENRYYIANLKTLVTDISKPVIVAGNFNSTIFTDAMSPISDAKLTRGPFSLLHGTWPVSDFPLALETDHIFTRDGAIIYRYRNSSIGSDHYPIGAEVLVPFVP